MESGDEILEQYSDSIRGRFVTITIVKDANGFVYRIVEDQDGHEEIEELES